MTVPNSRNFDRRAQLVIERLRFPAYLGWTSEERRSTQSLFVSLELNLNGVPNATRSDCLEETICYGQLVQKLSETLENQTFKLLERVAEEVESCLESFQPLIEEYKITIEKEFVPIPTPFESVKFVLRGKAASE